MKTLKSNLIITKNTKNVNNLYKKIKFSKTYNLIYSSFEENENENENESENKYFLKLLQNENFNNQIILENIDIATIFKEIEELKVLIFKYIFNILKNNIDLENENFTIKFDFNIATLLTYFKNNNRIFLEFDNEKVILENSDSFKTFLDLIYDNYKDNLKIINKNEIKKQQKQNQKIKNIEKIEKYINYFNDLDIEKIDNINKINYLLYTKLKKLKNLLDLRHYYKNNNLKNKIKELKNNIDIKKIENELKNRRKIIRQLQKQKQIKKLKFNNIKKLNSFNINTNFSNINNLKNLDISIVLSNIKKIDKLNLNIEFNNIKNFDSNLIIKNKFNNVKKIDNSNINFNYNKLIKLLDNLHITKINFKQYKKFSKKIDKIYKTLNQLNNINKKYKNEIKILLEFIKNYENFNKNIDIIKNKIIDLEKLKEEIENNQSENYDISTDTNLSL